MNILILDDQVQYGRSLDRALRNDYGIVLATSLPEAQMKLTDDICGLLVDVRLDESDSNNRQGLEFVSWARTKMPRVKIISMSALDDESIEADSFAAGANRFLRKPIVISQLKALLTEMFAMN